MQAEAKNRRMSFRVDASSTNIPTSYSAASGSLLTSSLGALGFTHLKVLNETTSRIAVCNTDVDSGVPGSNPVTNPYQMYVSDEFVEFNDGQHVYACIYLRSDTGSAITSGVVVVEVWG